MKTWQDDWWDEIDATDYESPDLATVEVPDLELETGADEAEMDLSEFDVELP